ncbi:hypothetical protein GCM10025883_21940 [Mobilicoccus caccae]|uniref:Uncharacterized protein n=1 Tax=Mobilicoccus caccae TaxID=1859295 RepID=A0ABQ6IQJ3_9MICO|nr:hypothetical protein GCM10025883_21940 [Mobilicoccus caccae]
MVGGDRGEHEGGESVGEGGHADDRGGSHGGHGDPREWGDDDGQHVAPGVDDPVRRDDPVEADHDRECPQLGAVGPHERRRRRGGDDEESGHGECVGQGGADEGQDGEGGHDVGAHHEASPVDPVGDGTREQPEHQVGSHPERGHGGGDRGRSAQGPGEDRKSESDQARGHHVRGGRDEVADEARRLGQRRDILRAGLTDV